MKPRDLNMIDRHIDIGGKYGDQEERQKPASDELNPTLSDQQADTAEKFADAANEDASVVKWDGRRDDLGERLRMAEVKNSGGEKKRGQEQTEDEPKHMINCTTCSCSGGR